MITKLTHQKARALRDLDNNKQSYVVYLVAAIQEEKQHRNRTKVKSVSIDFSFIGTLPSGKTRGKYENLTLEQAVALLERIYCEETIRMASKIIPAEKVYNSGGHRKYEFDYILTYEDGEQYRGRAVQLKGDDYHVLSFQRDYLKYSLKYAQELTGNSRALGLQEIKRIETFMARYYTLAA